jgi:hypothetical protein
MENHNFIFVWEDYKFPIQIIKLQDSFFVYVGKQNFSFDNLIVSNLMRDQNEPNCHTFIDDEFSEVGKNLASKLVMKFKCPFYVSFNIEDDMLNFNRGLYLILEKNIFDKVTEIKG